MMTTLTFAGHRPTTGASSAADSVFARLTRGFDHWLARRAMAGLDDEALHDIGVARGAIDAAVRDGRRALRG